MRQVETAAGERGRAQTAPRRGPNAPGGAPSRHDRRATTGLPSASGSTCRRGRCATGRTRGGHRCGSSPWRSRRSASTRCGCPTTSSARRRSAARSGSGSAGRSSPRSPRRRRGSRSGRSSRARGFRNPALLAKMAETLDEVSGGRVVLGLGSGVPARDPSWRAFGYDGSRHVVEVRRGGRDRHPARARRCAHLRGPALPGDGAVIVPRGPRAGAHAGVRRRGGRPDRAGRRAPRGPDQRRTSRSRALPTRPTSWRSRAARARRSGATRPRSGSRAGVASRSTTDGVAIEKPGCLVGEPAEVAATVRAIRDVGVEHLTMYAAAADDPSPLPALTEAYLDRFAPFLEANPGRHPDRRPPAT